MLFFLAFLAPPSNKQPVSIFNRSINFTFEVLEAVTGGVL